MKGLLGLLTWLGVCSAGLTWAALTTPHEQPGAARLALQAQGSTARPVQQDGAGALPFGRLGRHHIYGKPPPYNHTRGALPSGHWTGLRATCTGSGQRLVGTAYTQRKLYELQHPADCTTAQFLLTPQHYAGIGSIVHVAGQALAVASALGRVLLMEFDAQAPFHDPAWCGADQAFDRCYFLPLSSCPAPQATPGDVVTLTSWEQAHALRNVRVLRVDKLFLSRSRHEPRALGAFAQLLEAGPVDPSKRFYWWRAQAAAYLVRPNARMLRELAALRAAHFAGRAIQPGTVSVHVRRGDKVTESANTPTPVYLEKAAQALHAQPGALGRRIFLSTDDPQAVQELGSVTGWEVACLDLERKADASKSIPQYAREVGPGREMAESLLNLDLALECSAWVGTLSSNWCRLIDELRATVRCKAGGVYLDAQQAYPPDNLDW